MNRTKRDKGASIPVRLCEHADCRLPLVRRDREEVNKFRKRRFCNIQCAGHAAKKRTPLQPHPCKTCGKPIVQRANENRHHANERNYCDSECRRRGTSVSVRSLWAAREKPAATKHCVVCGASYAKRKKQTWGAWEKRRSCAKRSCLLTVRNAAIREAWGAKKRRKKQTNGWHAASEAWRANLYKPSEPVKFKGATSVEEFLAMGGEVTKCPPAACAPINSGFGFGK